MCTINFALENVFTPPRQWPQQEKITWVTLCFICRGNKNKRTPNQILLHSLGYIAIIDHFLLCGPIQ